MNFEKCYLTASGNTSRAYILRKKYMPDIKDILKNEDFGSIVGDLCVDTRENRNPARASGPAGWNTMETEPVVKNQLGIGTLKRLLYIQIQK